ncbi:MAG: hypothetical protein INQ03_20500 [Candidatus Heimdallarchaeota archaeon]|nr:hypothetical protein [Candidatus Heimdallarchaeota archaeon]
MNSILVEVSAIIADSKYLVIFTGAGISTPSGLPDYRGPEGVWTLRDQGKKPKPLSKPLAEHEPNAAHYAVVELQNMGIMKFLISQNVDGLHIKSGIKPKNIAELHGNTNYFKCFKCDKRYLDSEIGWDKRKYGGGYRTSTVVEGQPSCPSCHSRIISSIINFEDPMPESEMKDSNKHTQQADVFLVIGSSLSVYPAVTFPRKAKKNGAKLIIINLGETALDDQCDYKIESDCAIVLPQIVEIINKF